MSPSSIMNPVANSSNNLGAGVMGGALDLAETVTRTKETIAAVFIILVTMQELECYSDVVNTFVAFYMC